VFGDLERQTFSVKPSVKVSVKPSVTGLEKVGASSEKVLAIPREFDSF
jgi:hypothetical protein